MSKEIAVLLHAHHHESGYSWTKISLSSSFSLLDKSKRLKKHLELDGAFPLQHCFALLWLLSVFSGLAY